MPKEHLPIYQIQDFNARNLQEHYFYFSSLANHLQEHLFVQEPHKHNFYIVLLFTSGQGMHTIDFKTYEVTPNTAFFMMPGQVHSWELSKDADGFVLFFTSEFYLSGFPNRKLYNFPFFNALLQKPILQLTANELTELSPLLNYLRQEYEQKNARRNEILCCYLEIMLIKLTRIYLEKEPEKIGANHEFTLIQTFDNALEIHYKEHKPVSFYADQLNITSRHLNNICKRTLGKTTNELIQERSKLEAQRLLVHSDLTSSQIAAELGYFDNTYFFRFFKKHTGLTPEQFRNLNR